MASNKKYKTIGLLTRELFSGGFCYFMAPFVFFVIAGAIALIVFNKGEIVLAVNSFSTPWLDFFFLWITKLGLGGAIAAIGAVFLLYRFRWSLLVFINLAWTGIWTNLFKRIIFPMTPRPFHFFYYDDFPRFLYDAPLSYYNSFPSGHTMTIFAFCGLMAFLIKKKTAAILFFILAVVVGLSRIYLLQHFFIDTYFGAVLGIVSTFLTIWIDKKFDFPNKSFMNKNLIKLFCKK